MNLKQLRSPLKIKAGDIADDGTFTGYGSVFNVVDNGGDMIVPGAFAASLERHKSAGTRPKMLWQHDSYRPIGSWLEMTEDDHGLRCKGRLLLDVEQAREAYALMKAGELDGLSIGYECTEWEHATADSLQAKYGYYGECYGAIDHVRVLKAVELWEISPVTFPMCEQARVETVKQRSRSVLDLTPISEALARRGALLA